MVAKIIKWSIAKVAIVAALAVGIPIPGTDVLKRFGYSR